MKGRRTNGHDQELAGPHNAEEPINVVKHGEEHFCLCRGGCLGIRKHEIESQLGLVNCEGLVGCEGQKIAFDKTSNEGPLQSRSSVYA